MEIDAQCLVTSEIKGEKYFGIEVGTNNGEYLDLFIYNEKDESSCRFTIGIDEFIEIFRTAKKFFYCI